MAAAESIVEVLPPSRAIPVSVLESFRSWWAVGPKGSAASEERLLRKLPFFLPKGVPMPTPMPPLIAQSSLVRLTPPTHYINTFSMLPTTQTSDRPPVVLLHGYGAGLGFFFRNLPALGEWAAARGRAVYALDWLGMGRSARVPFRVRAARANVQARVAEAEAFFVDSLEAWRETMGLERISLVGHSLGAYLSVVYALRHPERVERLVLLSPAGVTRDPRTTAEVARDEAVAATMERAEKRRESGLRRLAMHLWEEGWSPFQVVRSMGMFAPLVVGKYSARRFSGLTEEETRDMHDYILNITMAKGSGEYCISHILAPGAHARMPLVERVAGLEMPVTFVYGDHDWMDAGGGEEAVRRLRAAGNRAGRVYVVGEAGHHVYLDNPSAVNALLVKELDK